MCSRDYYLRLVEVLSASDTAYIVEDCILSLQKNPMSQDAKKLAGYENYTRIDTDEYRIIYRFENQCVVVVLVGKRNDDEVYRIAKRTLK